MVDIPPERFIGSQLRVQLHDERILDGVLTVMDPFGNLLMSNVYETNQKNYREIGLVSVPRESISNVYMSKKGWKNICN